MNRGITRFEVALIIMAACMVVLFINNNLQNRPDDSVSKEMKAAGCFIVDYAGRRAEYRVYRCPEHADLLTEREWKIRRGER